MPIYYAILLAVWLTTFFHGSRSHLYGDHVSICCQSQQQKGCFQKPFSYRGEKSCYHILEMQGNNASLEKMLNTYICLTQSWLQKNKGYPVMILILASVIIALKSAESSQKQLLLVTGEQARVLMSGVHLPEVPGKCGCR